MALSPPLTNLNEPLFEQQPTTRVRRLLKASRPPFLRPRSKGAGGRLPVKLVLATLTPSLSIITYTIRAAG